MLTRLGSSFCRRATINLRPQYSFFSMASRTQAASTQDTTTPETASASVQAGSGTEGISSWKVRAPYKIHSGDGFETKLKGACHCGKVDYQLSRDTPLASKLCHCTTCQTQHGAPYQWAAIFHKEDINFTSGHHNLEWYDPTSKSIEHQLPCKVRCSHCHSPIMDEGRNMILLFPSLIKFPDEEARKKFHPAFHMFYKERVMDIPDGLPKWTGINDNSELMDEK